MANISKPLNQGFAAPNIVANYGPYSSVAAAHTALSEDGLNVVGMTVGIKTGDTITEYWYQGGTTQSHLVQKHVSNNELDALDSKFTTAINNLENITGDSLLVTRFKVVWNLLDSAEDIDTIINKFNEIVNFLEGIDENRKLKPILDGITSLITEKANKSDVYLKSETYTKNEVDAAIESIDVSEQLENVAFLGDNGGQAVIPEFDPQTDTLLKTTQSLTNTEKETVISNILDKNYIAGSYVGKGKKYLKLNVGAPVATDFDGFVDSATTEQSSLAEVPDNIYFDRTNNRFIASKGEGLPMKYYMSWQNGDAYMNPNSGVYFKNGDNYYQWNGTTLEAATVGNVNRLTQADFNTENTIYVIRYDFDLCGQSITIPEGCVLEFDGGSLKNGTLVCNETTIKGDTCCLKPSLSVRGQYNGFLKASWIGLSTQDSTEILKSLDTMLFDKRQLSLDVDVTVNEGGIILPKDIIIEGCNHKIINTCTSDYSYMFALSNNATLKDVEFCCSNTDYEGIILLWSTDTFKEASPEKCMLSNVQIVCSRRADFQYKATGLCIKATASGAHHNYISNCNVYNLQIKNVKDGLVLINDNTDGTSSDFAWSNNICFDYLYVSSNNRAVTLNEINPNNVGNSIGPYIIGNLMAQAINSEGSSPIVYYISADIANTKLLVNSDESWDYHDEVGELHGGNLSVEKTLLYRYSYDLNQTDEKGTYDYIGRIKKYTGSYLSLGSYPGHKRSIIKPNYNPATGDNVNVFQALENGWDLVDGVTWNKSGNIEYRRGNSTDGDRNGVFTFYRHLTNPNTATTKLITTPNGIVTLYYDPVSNCFKPICKNVIWKNFSSSETNISDIQLHQYTPFAFCQLKLNSLSTDSFYRVIIRVKNSSLGTDKALKSVFGNGCVVLNKYVINNTQTLDSYSSFMTYIKPERSSCELVFLLYYNENLYKSDSQMINADLDYYTTDITATAIQRSFNQVSSNSDTIDYITASNIFPKGFGLYEESHQKTIWWNGTAWVDATGIVAETPTSGTFANKPTVATNNIPVGFKYFCTDKQTTEGTTDGIEIIHKGNDVWVDALGRTIS